MPIDKVELEILKNHTRAAAEAMAFTLYRTAHSTFVKETEDFTTGLTTPEGETFATPTELGATWFVGLNYGRAIAMIDDYLKVLSTKDVDLPEGYHNVVAAAGPVKEALAAADLPLAPCHCDPLCENFLDTGAEMWIVDWEYSGMNDPMWDLGDLSVEAGMDAAQDAEMMQAYFGRAPTGFETGRMVIYKAMCDLLWTLWGLIQHADGNPAEDFWAYSTGRFARCKALMQDPAFDRHVAAVRAG